MPLKPVAVSNYTQMFSYSPSTSFIIIFLHLNLNTILESISQLKFNLRETFVTLFDRQFNPILILFDFVKTSPWNLCSTLGIFVQPSYSPSVYLAKGLAFRMLQRHITHNNAHSYSTFLELLFSIFYEVLEMTFHCSSPFALFLSS
jgi:hypothetical protein